MIGHNPVRRRKNGKGTVRSTHYSYLNLLFRTQHAKEICLINCNSHAAEHHWPLIIDHFQHPGPKKMITQGHRTENGHPKPQKMITQDHRTENDHPGPQNRKWSPRTTEQKMITQDHRAENDHPGPQKMITQDQRKCSPRTKEQKMITQGHRKGSRLCHGIKFPPVPDHSIFLDVWNFKNKRKGLELD